MEATIKAALTEQYHAGLAMLAECVEKCPDAVWIEGEYPRQFWRIVWHTLYFTHNYLVQTEADFNNSVADWPAAVRTALGVGENQKAVDVEPYELPNGVPVLSQQEMLGYIAYVRGLVDATVAHLDLDKANTGFSWYPNQNKLSHELMNLRHLQGHVGQLSERLMAHEIDTDWIGK